MRKRLRNCINRMAVRHSKYMVGSGLDILPYLEEHDGAILDWFRKLIPRVESELVLQVVDTTFTLVATRHQNVGHYYNLEVRIDKEVFWGEKSIFAATEDSWLGWCAAGITSAYGIREQGVLKAMREM